LKQDDSKSDKDAINYGVTPSSIFNNAQNVNVPDYIALLKEAADEEFFAHKQDTYITEITSCPRQYVFKAIDPLPITFKQINTTSIGKAAHQAFYRLMKRFPGRFISEMYIEHKTVNGMVDLYDKKEHIPIDLKTTKLKIRLEKPRHWDAEQTKYYMAILDRPIGVIIYQYVSECSNEPFQEFVLQMSPSDTKLQMQKLLKEAESLQLAKNAKDPSLARHIAYDRELNWMCAECPYAKSCEEMRTAERKKIF
jgi:hypothetical protein